MRCPECKKEMVQALNRSGKIIDYCEICQGMWLDKGEIFGYTKRPTLLAQALTNGLINSREGKRECPRCDTSMQVGGLFKADLEVDCCHSCGGIWLDSGELNVLKNLTELGLAARNIDQALRITPRLKDQLDPAKLRGDVEREIEAQSSVARSSGDALSELQAAKRAPASAAELASFPLPNLFFRSLVTMSLLFGVLFIIMVIVSESLGLSPMASIGVTAALLLVQFLVSPFLLDWQLSWLFSCNFVKPEGLPPHLRKFVDTVCRNNDMTFPSFGIIEDMSPNAFTYGNHPGNARVVITRGLIAVLKPEELESVVAHELGHAVNWDMAIMTVAGMVPIILYQIYRTLMRFVQRSRGGKNDSKGPILLIAIGAYICYLISEYIVLFLSRTREYHADRFAAEASGNSSTLASALIKVAYGLASDAVGTEASAEGAESKASSGSGGHMMASLGIFDPMSAKALVASTAVMVKGAGEMDKERVKDAMQWDLWNPWAWWYELHSTHPLVAHRLDQLGRLSFRYGHKPYILFDRKQPESYWDEFLVDFLLLWLPWILALVGLVFGARIPKHALGAAGGAMLGLGAGSFLQLLLVYGFDFFPHTVASLLKQVKVSSIRAIPARIKGKIIGKGIPGYILSEDMTFQDETGFMFMDYQQPLAVMEWYFALAKDAYVGKDVVIEGWYKRAPVPYFEIYSIKAGGPSSILETSWSFLARCLFYPLLMVGGFTLFLL